MLEIKFLGGFLIYKRFAKIVSQEFLGLSPKKINQQLCEQNIDIKHKEFFALLLYEILMPMPSLVVRGGESPSMQTKSTS
jgi:hypothetical protein